jgi:hypothetical protein
LTLALTCFLSPRRGHTLDRHLKIGAIRVGRTLDRNAPKFLFARRRFVFIFPAMI